MIYKWSKYSSCKDKVFQIYSTQLSKLKGSINILFVKVGAAIGTVSVRLSFIFIASNERKSNIFSESTQTLKVKTETTNKEV